MVVVIVVAFTPSLVSAPNSGCLAGQRPCSRPGFMAFEPSSASIRLLFPWFLASFRYLYIALHSLERQAWQEGMRSRQACGSAGSRPSMAS